MRGGVGGLERRPKNSSTQLDVTSGRGGGQIILCEGPVAVFVLVFTDKLGRLRLDVKIMCQTQEFNQARRDSVCLFFFPLRNVLSIFFIGVCTDTNVLEAVLAKALANHEIGYGGGQSGPTFSLQASLTEGEMQWK